MIPELPSPSPARGRNSCRSGFAEFVILLTIIGLVLAWRWTRLGLVVATFGGVLLYLASMPVVADYLIGSVEALAGTVPILPADAPPGAIIVLSAD